LNLSEIISWKTLIFNGFQQIKNRQNSFIEHLIVDKESSISDINDFNMHLYTLAFNKMTFPILQVDKLSVNNTLHNQKKGRKTIKILTNVKLKAIFKILLTNITTIKKNKGEYISKKGEKI